MFLHFVFHQPYINFAREQFQSVQFHKFWPSLRLKTSAACRNRLTQRVQGKEASLHWAGNSTTDILDIFKNCIPTDTDLFFFSRSQRHHTYSHTTHRLCLLTNLLKVSKIWWTQLLHNQKELLGSFSNEGRGKAFFKFAVSKKCQRGERSRSWIFGEPHLSLASLADLYLPFLSVFYLFSPLARA